MIIKNEFILKMNIYTEDISYELTNDEIQEIETQMITEFNIIKENLNYIINGKRFNLPGLWRNDNPLSNIEYLLSGNFVFHDSLTDQLCRKIHFKHKAIVDAKIAKQGNR